MISISSPGLSLRRYSAQSSLHALPPIPATPKLQHQALIALMIVDSIFVYCLKIIVERQTRRAFWLFSLFHPCSAVSSGKVWGKRNQNKSLWHFIPRLISCKFSFSFYLFRFSRGSSLTTDVKEMCFIPGAKICLAERLEENSISLKQLKMPRL